MTITAKRLVSAQTLTSSNATYYTVPANTTTIVKNGTLCNSGAAAVLATVYLVPSGGAAGVGNQVIAVVSIGPKVTYTCPELVNKVLVTGATIVAKDDTGSVTGFDVSGTEIN